MKKMIFLLSLALGLAPLLRAQPVSISAGAVSAPVLAYPTTFRGMAAQYKGVEKQYLSSIEAVMAIPAAERNFANTVKALDEADVRFNEGTSGASFMEAVSPDRKIQRMASALDRRSSSLGIKLADRDDIYQAYKDAAAKGENLTGEDAKLLKETLRGYERRGMGLPQAQRDRMNAIRKRLSDLSQAFSNNLKGVFEGIEADPSRLEGLPEGYLNGRPRTADGKVKIGLDYPSYGPFMEFAKDSELRRELYMKENNRAADKNIAVLEEVIKLRQEISGILGQKSFAHSVLENRMAKTPETVMSFLGRLKDLLAPGAKVEEASLLEEARRDNPALESISAWDRPYYSARLRKRLYDFDTDQVRQYFPVDTVIEGTMKIYQNLFGVTFNERPAQAWHPEVRLFEITDTASGKSVGYFYLDLYPRDHKYDHMAAFSLVQGRELPDGSYRKPVAAMVGNFTKATEDRPSLLSHGEVETFFHEFGHLMHQTLTKARYTSFSGTSVARDFVETPSQMLENFVWRPEIIAQLSGHWQRPAEKLPQALLDKMLAAQNYNTAIATLRQIAFASLDMAYNTATGPVDAMAVMNRVWAETGVPAAVPGTHFPATFGHLMGYAAGYYGYLWSRVYAQDGFGRFEREGIENPVVGLSWRREVLEKGSSRDEAESLKAFLGRDPNEEAFLQYLGLPPASATP